MLTYKVGLLKLNRNLLIIQVTHRQACDPKRCSAPVLFPMSPIKRIVCAYKLAVCDKPEVLRDTP